jgi:type IV secretory pathway VirB10-like protein
MTFDPETLYAKPSPGRRIHPMVFVAAGLGAVAVVGGLATMDQWLPSGDTVASGPPPIRSQNSGNGSAPLAFPNRYAPVVYNPPPAPAADPQPAAAEPAPPPPPPVPTPAPAPRSEPRAPKERVSMLALDSGGVNRSGASGNPTGTPAAGGAGSGVQRVADNRGGRENFYGAAGSNTDAFQATGITGQIGPCTIAPGYFLFHDAVGRISTDTPGQVTAKTSRPIYAGPKGQCYASPPGATLVGAFNSNTSYGEERIQVAWTTLILPNGRMIALGGMPGASGDGGAGLQADVNNHTGSLAVAVIAGAAVDTIRGIASFGGGQRGDVVINMGGALADRTASIGERLVDRELSRRPTLTAKMEEMAVQVTRPIVLERYRD